MTNEAKKKEEQKTGETLKWNLQESKIESGKEHGLSEHDCFEESLAKQYLHPTRSLSVKEKSQ